MRSQPLFTWLMQIAMFFFVLKLVAGLPGGVGIVALLILVGILVAVILWMLKFQPETAARLYRTKPGKCVVGTVCRLSDQQPPVGVLTQQDFTKSLTLRTTNDFSRAAKLLITKTFGHDRAISDLLLHLQKTVLLRQAQSARTRNRALGVYVLAGPSGCGKRTFSIRLGQLLHVHPCVHYFDLSGLGDADRAWTVLFGDATRKGALSGAVISEPFHTVICDQLNVASTPFLVRLAKVLETGQAVDGSNGRVISFENCVFLFLWQGSLKGVHEGKNGGMTADTFIIEQEICPEFGSQIQQLIVMDTPSRVDQAKVVASLMHRECQKYGIELDYVAPEILVRELRWFTAEKGFAPLPNRISRLLADPLLRASRHGQRRLVLENVLELEDESVQALCP